jgi:hypothetical protein
MANRNDWQPVLDKRALTTLASKSATETAQQRCWDGGFNARVCAYNRAMQRAITTRVNTQSTKLAKTRGLVRFRAPNQTDWDLVPVATLIAIAKDHKRGG